MTDNSAIVAAIDEMGDEDPDEAVLLLEPRSSYDKCVIGLGFRFHDTFVVYDKQCILETIIAEGEPYDEDVDPPTEALEHFEFNIVGGWVGPHTPVFVTTDPDDL